MCFYIVEDDLHLMTCKHPAQAATVQEMIRKLRKDLQCNDQAKHTLINIIQVANKDKAGVQIVTRSSQKEIVKGQEHSTMLDGSKSSTVEWLESSFSC
jgi:hypothetical protein